MLKEKNLLKIGRGKKNLKVKLLDRKVQRFSGSVECPFQIWLSPVWALHAMILPSFAVQVYLESKQKTNVCHHHQVMPEGCDVWSTESKTSRVKVSFKEANCQYLAIW